MQWEIHVPIYLDKSRQSIYFWILTSLAENWGTPNFTWVQVPSGVQKQACGSYNSLPYLGQTQIPSHLSSLKFTFPSQELSIIWIVVSLISQDFIIF